jgi:hypothetical protein
LFSKDKDAIKDLKEQLYKRVEIIDLGPTSYYLGTEIARDRKNQTISLTQSKFPNEIIKRFNKD